MTLLIGITQNPNEADKQIFQEFKVSGGQTIVGPFMTSKDASEWMTFMINRREGYEQIPLMSNFSGKGLWYGITVEYFEARIH